MRFRIPPQVKRPGIKPRKLLTSATYRPALYTAFLVDPEDNDSEWSRLWKDYFLNESGEKGVLHGDVKNTSNAMVSKSGHVVWIDFDSAQVDGTSFLKKATREIRVWNHYFRSMIRNEGREHI